MSSGSSLKEKIEKIIASMSLKDKIALCSGKDFWHTKDFEKYGIPSIMMADGPHGLRKQIFTSDMLGLNGSVETTCFPTAVTSGSTWNRELLEKEGEAIAEEALANDVAIVLGPGLNIKRNPLCGRNFEYFSEDPVLSGEMAASFVRGLQKNGVACSLKHFACNNQEYLRFSSDSLVDERALREIYLAGFERAVKKSSPKTVMCAYNKINGTYCASNKKLLTDILRDEWGFDGMVVTDWGAMNNRTQGFAAGCDLSMPGGSSYQERDALKDIRKGKISTEDLDRSVRRILTRVFEGQKIMDADHQRTFSQEEHHELAGKIAEEGLVLLKNDPSLFPLESFDGILICGPMAKDIRYQGSGSSRIKPTRLTQFLEICEGECKSLGESFSYEEAVSGKADIIEESFERAIKKASAAKAVLVFAGLTDSYESEGFDRSDMTLPPSFNRLIESLAEVNKNVGVVLFGGGAMELPWEEKVSSILYCGLAGQNAASAIYKILRGKINPSGRLTESWPLKYDACPSAEVFSMTKKTLPDFEKNKNTPPLNFVFAQKKSCYLESIFTGYRYYLSNPDDVRYHFGFGLSYTSFSYDKMEIDGKNVKVKITNRGKRDGSEVVQIYVEAKGTSLPRPVRELKDFAKLSLKSGESAEVSFEMDERWFEVYHEGWKILPGEYFICAASSANQVMLREKISLPGGFKTENVNASVEGWYQNPQGKPNVRDWENLSSMSAKSPSVPGKGKYSMDNSLTELCKDSKLVREIKRFLEKSIAKNLGLPEADYDNEQFKMAVACSSEIPLHALIISAGGIFPKWLARFLVFCANH